MIKISLPKKITKPQAKIVLLSIAGLAAACLIGVFGWFAYNLRPVNSAATESVNFTLPQGQKVTVIADRLEDQGLIRSSSAFLAYITLRGARSQLQAGSYTLSPSLSVKDITAIISQGRIKTNLLVVPEGTSVSQIIELAAEKGIKPEDMRAALGARHDHEFLAAKPKNTGLEGYLFPDSYNVDDKTTAADLVASMLDNFESKVPGKFTTALKKQGLSLHEGLTLASIVEKEVNTAADRPLVAQVFLKRLGMGMKLETDPTVDYAAKQLGVPFNLSLDSPYNTYRFEGLPPGPISNPGLSSLEAVINPAKTDYLYFVTGKDQVTRFAADFSGHQRNIARHGVSGN